MQNAFRFEFNLKKNVYYIGRISTLKLKKSKFLHLEPIDRSIILRL